MEQISIMLIDDHTLIRETWRSKRARPKLPFRPGIESPEPVKRR
jgi:hypothetical protein